MGNWLDDLHLFKATKNYKLLLSLAEISKDSCVIYLTLIIAKQYMCKHTYLSAVYMNIHKREYVLSVLCELLQAVSSVFFF